MTIFHGRKLDTFGDQVAHSFYRLARTDLDLIDPPKDGRRCTLLLRYEARYNGCK